MGGLAVNGTLMVIGAAVCRPCRPSLLWGAGRLRAGIPGRPSIPKTRSTFSVRSGVRSMNEIFPLDQVREAYDRMLSGKARFRVVMAIGK